MPTFTEEAVLRVRDESSATLKKVNQALRDLQKTAAGLKSKKIDLGLDTKGISKAQADIRKLAASINQLKSARVNLAVNATGLNQASRQLTQLHSQASKPITTFIKGAVAGAGYTAVHAAGRAVTEGTRTADIGEASLALKQLTDEHRKFVDEQISAISKQQAERPGGAMWSRGAITQQMSEMLGTVNVGAAVGEEDFKSRVAQAKFMSDQNLELARTLVTLGESADQAREDSVKFGKAIDLQAQVYDKATGKMDPKKATEAYDQIRALIPAIGREMSGSNFLQTMKMLRSSKFALAPEAMALAMRNFEDMGVSAAVGLNQMIKTTGGSAKKAALEEQRRLGLIDTKLVPKGKVGKQEMKETAGSISEENAKLLREHPQQWIDTKVVPALLKDLIRQGLTQEQALAKTFDPAWVATQVGKMYSDRTAQDMATLMILQRNENAQFLKDWSSRTGDLATQRSATQLSVIGATTAIGQQMQSAFGEAVRAIAPALVPTLNVVSDSMRQFADTTYRASQGDVAAKQKLESGAIVAAVTAPFLKMGFDVTKGILGPVGEAINAVARPLGQISALQAMGSANEGVRALGASAQAQLSAADAMNAATVVQAGGWDKLKQILGPAALALIRGGGALGLASTVMGGTPGAEVPPELAKATPAEREAMYARDKEKYERYREAVKRKDLVDAAVKADAQVQDAQTNLANHTEALAKARKAGIKAEIDRMTRLVAQDNALLAERKAAYDRLNKAAQELSPAEQRRMLPPMKVEPKKPFESYISEAKPVPVFDVKEGRTKREIRDQGKPKLPSVPVPTADPRKAGFTAPPENAINLLIKSNESFAQSSTSFMQGIGEARTIFDGVPARIAEGGTSAGNSIASSMTGAAGAAGDIIAGKIRTAASNITVNVNVGGVNRRGDTGNSSASDKPIST